MICTYYYVKVRNKKKKLLAMAKVYSFDEAYYRISMFREEFPEAYYFTIEYTDTKIM